MDYSNTQSAGQEYSYCSIPEGYFDPPFGASITIEKIGSSFSKMGPKEKFHNDSPSEEEDGSRTIILVEKRKYLRRFLAGALRQRGYRVVECRGRGDTLEALGSELLDAQHPGRDMVISDLSEGSPQDASFIRELAKSGVVGALVAFTSKIKGGIQSQMWQQGIMCISAPISLGIILSCIESLG